MSNELRDAALYYHSKPNPGKIATSLSKPTTTQYDLSLAYTPGVAEPVKEIIKNPEDAYLYTGKGNLVGVITNGTAVLGLGDVGALAGKPVMEGKVALFKQFADIDAFDIEINCKDPFKLIEIIESLSPTFGGINLEDIRAPECFIVESELKKRLDIPVLHDDQQGTAIVVAAALLNALEIQGKTLQTAQIVCLGAGAAGIATLKLLISLGALKENCTVIDREGIIHDQRLNLNQQKQFFALSTSKRSLEEAMKGADVFIGVSGPNLLFPQMIKSMAKNPIIFALSNPLPEIMPEIALSVRSDLIIATGRSDYPNQVNNVLCFPYLFRGALDVRATTINEAMQIACVFALKELAKEPIPQQVLSSYDISDDLKFGKNYLLPKPNDFRLRNKIATAVARAAVKSGVAHKNLNNDGG